MFSTISHTKFTYLLLILYIFFVSWWIRLNFAGLPQPEAFYFDALYGLIPLLGGLYAIFVVSKIWGGYRSIIGKGIIFIAIGLLAQAFGLEVWTYYNLVLKVELPYPSLADVGYFALIPFYTLGALQFAKAAGGKYWIKTAHGKVFAILIPFIMLLVAYGVFVKNIGFSFEDPIKTFFDFGYPLGEIIPVSIAMFTLSLSKKLLGGKMKTRILYLIFAFFFQFLTEYTFLYLTGINMLQNGGLSDILYLTSYMIISMALISFRRYD